MNESNSQPEKPKNERRYDPELLKKGLRCDLDQYEMLKRCSDKRDMTEWNEYRKNHLNDKVWLQGAYLVHANLQGARLIEVDLLGANLATASLMKAELWEANLERANLDMANLQSAFLQGSNLRGAFIPLAHLEGADLIQANLQDAHLVGANLQGTILREANLEGANFETATVDGGTLIWNCKVSRYSKNKSFTNFEGVGLDSARIDPGTKQLLEYNIRRKNWEQWYPKQNCLLRWVARAFWWVSDYGISAPRIMIVFLLAAVAFAVIYYLWGLIAPPGIVDYLFVDPSGVKVGVGLALIRAIHFSVVIMTVGFTNMHANAHSFWAHILVGFQMILGFVLLGALVTRFAVLFTAGGPAGRFANDK